MNGHDIDRTLEQTSTALSAQFTGTTRDDIDARVQRLPTEPTT